MHLSRREKEVVILLAEGCSNKEIAARLHVTIGTVKVYVYRIMHKTGAGNRVQLAMWHAMEKIWNENSLILTGKVM